MTGIYGTMGPSCEDQEILEAMLERGMTGIRINMSHATPEECRGRVETCRAACRTTGRSCEIVLDLKGPETRVGWLKKPLFLKKGDELVLKSKLKGEMLPVLSVPPAVVNAAEPGDRLLIHDGMVTVEVMEELPPEIIPPPEGCEVPESESGAAPAVDDLTSPETGSSAGQTEASDVQDEKAEPVVRRRFLCRTVCGGKVSSQQSVKIENKEIDGPVLSNADLNALDLAKDMGIDGVMLSFVRCADDVLEARAALTERGLNVRVFSKIETRTGMAHLYEIMQVSDVIIIARGDLGNAMPLWELPGAQKRIAAACKEAGVPFMVATQMLQSMAGKAVPYRAEVLDIYNAILDGASYVMVTGETAVGKFPVEVIDILAKTVHAAQLDYASIVR